MLRTTFTTLGDENMTDMEISMTSDVDKASVIYNLLPESVQRRVPKISSLRRSASQYGRSMGHSRFPSMDSESSTAPPPSYRESPRTRRSLSNEDDAAFTRSLPGSRQSSSGYATPTVDDGSGVRWKYANQGSSLLSLSASEANSTTEDPPFARQLYVHALTYLLRGLPSRLSTEEEISLRAAIPASLVAPSPQYNQLVVRSSEPAATGPQPQPEPAPETSILHRTIANLTLYVFLLFNFILPYIQLLLRQAYRYDRHHKISDRLISQGITTADTVGKQTMTLASSVCALNEGKVVEAVKEVGVWWVQGVSGGVYQGLGEGMEVLGLKDGRDGRRGGEKRIKEEQD